MTYLPSDSENQKIYKAALTLLFPLSVKKTYEIIIQEALGLVNGRCGSIFLLSHGKMKRTYASEKNLFLIEPRRKGETERVYREQKATIRTLDDVIQSVPNARKIYKELNVEYDINIPLHYESKIFGVLSILSNIQFNENDSIQLELFSPFATLAIHQAKLREKLKKAVQDRDLFLSLAAHEVKTPLTTIYLYAEMLAKSSQNNEQQKVKENLLTEVKRLKRLMDELLDIDHMQLGNLHFEMKHHSLQGIITQSVNSFTYSHKQHPIIVESNLVKGKDTIYADRDKLMQVLSNILGNAAKYSNPETPIIVHLSINGNMGTVSVIDKGIGIAAKELSKIFNRYYRVEKKHQGGLGIGLFLTKHIVQKHNGSIKITSRIGKGTKVTISLPLSS